ncbi:hypothetical protein HYT52_00770 [Candidatus Woesearchaeota archaeon]|nr:hypothetical protein [Candidatus Woesearchaeota archaeon]
MLKKNRSLSERISQLPFAVTMTLKAGIALGLLYGAGVTIAHLENREPIKIEKTDSLEEALDKTLQKIESCPPESRTSEKETNYVGGSCYNQGVASISMEDNQMSFLCAGEGCSTRINLTFHEYVPRYDAPPKVTRTFTRTDFGLKTYQFSDAPKAGAFEFLAQHPTTRELTTYGAMETSPKLEAALERTRTRLRRF